VTAACSLRAAIPADAPAMAAILSDRIDATPRMPRLHSRAKDRCVLTAKDARGGAPVTLLDATVAGLPVLCDGWLSRPCVAAPAPGRGPGSARVQSAPAAGPVSLWCLQANGAASAFSLRHGLIETARTDGAATAEHLPDIRLESPGLAATKATGLQSARPSHFSGSKYPGGVRGGKASPAGRPAERAETRRSRP